MLRQTLCKGNKTTKIVVLLIRRMHSFGFEHLKTVGTQTLDAVQSAAQLLTLPRSTTARLACS